MKAMNLIDVFKILLDGGHICATENKISVCRKGSSFNGHITEKQFHELWSKDIIEIDIESTEASGRDKYGNTYIYFKLVEPAVCQQTAEMEVVSGESIEPGML